MGLVNVPGISPIKFPKPLQASANPSPGFLSSFALPLKSLQAAEQAELTAVKPPVEDSASKAPKPHPDMGDTKLAELWGAMDTPKLVALTASWPPASLAKILVKMDGDQVAEYLSALKADRATLLSKAIQRAASQPASDSVQS